MEEREKNATVAALGKVEGRKKEKGGKKTQGAIQEREEKKERK